MDDNHKNLPVALVEDGRLMNPEILDWSTSQDQSREEGRGFIWVPEDTPLKTLDPDAFAVRFTWGEVRFWMARERGMHAGLKIEHSRRGDRVWFHN